MKQRIYIWIAIAILLLFVFSCQTKYVPVEIKTTETVEFHDTTVLERLIPFKDSVAIRDTSSFLSNLYAYSWAKWSNGILQHSLGIWPGSVLLIKVPRYMTVTKRIEVPKIVEVEKKLNRWQKTKVDLGGYSIFFNVITIGLIITTWLKRRGGR